MYTHTHAAESQTLPKLYFKRGLLQPCCVFLRNKYLLLNSQELNELSAISMKANIPEVEALVNTDRSLVCDGKKGLLTRLLTVMKREPPDSSFRSAFDTFVDIFENVSPVFFGSSSTFCALMLPTRNVFAGSGRRGRSKVSSEARLHTQTKCSF